MRLIRYVLITSALLQIAFTIEPITTSIVVAAGAFFGTKYFDKIKLNSYCKYHECCMPNLIPHDILSLKEKLENKLFGQHIVQDKMFKAIASHYENIEKSKKPLVMTFHGKQGTGKNYVASMIAEAIFEKGTKSQYFHLFHGSQYEGGDRVYEHQREIKKEIFDAVEKCPYSVFVFDEVDKMPPKIFNTITSVLDHHGIVRGKDFTKSIFIFLTNYGGDEITKILYQLVKFDGLFREETKLHHFESIVRNDVFHQEGGLQESNLIKSAVIDFYLPFLPLEKKHVKKCIEAEYINFGREYVTEDMVKEIMNYVGFHEDTSFSHTGCKTVYAKVQAECF
jgi:ATP-dependent Clp protease ATP-binding subunit ClpA